MSYNVNFAVDVGAPDLVEVGDWHRSPTFNFWLMFEAVGLNLRDLNGLCGKYVAEALDSVISDLEAAPDEWRRYEPSNGWGCFESALKFLVELRAYANMWPEATLEVA